MSEIAWDCKHDVANLLNSEMFLRVLLAVGEKLRRDLHDAELDLRWVLGRLDNDHGFASYSSNNLKWVVLDVVLKVRIIKLAALHPLGTEYCCLDVLRNLLVRVVTYQALIFRLEADVCLGMGLSIRIWNEMSDAIVINGCARI